MSVTVLEKERPRRRTRKKGLPAPAAMRCDNCGELVVVCGPSLNRIKYMRAMCGDYVHVAGGFGCTVRGQDEYPTATVNGAVDIDGTPAA